MIPEFHIHFLWGGWEYGSQRNQIHLSGICKTALQSFINHLLCARHWPPDITLMSSNSYNNLERYYSPYFQMKN